jgi:hypothetical protein
VGDSATRRVRVVLGGDGPGKRRRSFDDVVVLVCFLALIGVAVLGGALMLLSWVTAALPVSRGVACPEVDGCVVPGPDDDHDQSVDDYRTDGLMPTR